MTIPTAIVLPGLVANLERFLRPPAATAGDGVEIRQDATGTTVSVCEGRHAATIMAGPPGTLEPILVDAGPLADADPSKPITLYRLAEASGVIAWANGELATVAIRPGPLPRSARDLADVVEGEIASGMTKAVFALDPRHLLAVAQALVATGAEKATVAIAPRWNVIACIAANNDVPTVYRLSDRQAKDHFNEHRHAEAQLFRPETETHHDTAARTGHILTHKEKPAHRHHLLRVLVEPLPFKNPQTLIGRAVWTPSKVILYLLFRLLEQVFFALLDGLGGRESSELAGRCPLNQCHLMTGNRLHGKAEDRHSRDDRMSHKRVPRVL